MSFLLQGEGSVGAENPQRERWTMDIAVFMLKTANEVGPGNHT